MPPSHSDEAAAACPPAAAGAAFLSRAAPSGGAAADPAAATRVLDGVADALARWFGPFGYHALLTRALAHARAAHPALAGVHVRAPLTPALDGIAEATHAYGSRAAAEGIAAVIAGVIDLVGSVIGDDMTLQLLERHVEPPVPTTLAPETDSLPDSLPDLAAPAGALVDPGSMDTRREVAP